MFTLPICALLAVAWGFFFVWTMLRPVTWSVKDWFLHARWKEGHQLRCSREVLKTTDVLVPVSGAAVHG